MQRDNIIESMPTDAYVCVYHFASHEREKEMKKEYKYIKNRSPVVLFVTKNENDDILNNFHSIQRTVKVIPIDVGSKRKFPLF